MEMCDIRYMLKSTYNAQECISLKVSLMPEEH